MFLFKKNKLKSLFTSNMLPILLILLSFSLLNAQLYSNEDKYALQVDKSCQCGQIKGNYLSGRIVGGKQAEMDVYSWMAAIKKDGRMVCGGSLINNRYVLTAGHCLYWSDVKAFTVFIDVFDQSKVKESAGYGIESFVVHEDYGTDKLHDSNDIGLIKLNREVMMTDKLSPVCLPSPGANLTHIRALVIGWGMLKQGGLFSPDKLQQATLTVMSNEECKQIDQLRDHIEPHMLCAFKNKVDACQGDSGGPLIRRNKNRAEQIGVVSWGLGCAQPGVPGVYTRVEKFLEWIVAHTQDSLYCADSTWNLT